MAGLESGATMRFGSGDRRRLVPAGARAAQLRATLFAAMLAAAAATSPQPAHAGTYRVVACDAAPGGASSAWRPRSDAGMLAYRACPSRGRATRGLVVRNRVQAGEVPHGRAALMAFEAPAGASLHGIEFDWDGLGASRQWTLGFLDADGRLIAGCDARAGGARSACVLGDPKGSRRTFKRLGGRRVVQIAVRCGVRGGCDTSPNRSADRARGRLAVHYAAVTVRDGSDPNLVPDGTGLLGGDWKRGVQLARLRAEDNVGVRSASFAIDGVVRRADRQGCDYTRRAPCPRTPILGYTLNTRLLTDGAHAVSATATDAAGNSRVVRRTIRVDNHAPGAPRDVRVLGPAGVRSHNSFDLRWTPPPGQAAPIVRTRYRLCRASGSGRCFEGMRPAGATGIDDLSVPDRGEWRFRAWLVDAAGNARRSTSSDPVTLRFDDRQPVRLSATVEVEGGTASRATIGFGKRPTVHGSLSAAGGGLSGAPVAVLSRTRGSKRSHRVATLRTDARGNFRYRVDRGPSRTLLFEYAGSEGHRPAGDRVGLAVRAKSSLSVNRRRVDNGERVRFEGRVLGRPVPREGKLLQLEAHYRDRWRTFAVVRSNRRGRWHYRYRFEATAGTVTYPFRVRIPRERSYPYAVGRSRVVKVVVRGG